MAETIPARYIKLRANAGTRVHVPTKYLTPDQQKQRARNLQIKRDNTNPLYNPLAPLSGHALKSAADRMAAADVDPEIASEQSNVDFLKRYAAATTQRMGDLYGQMAARIPGYQSANATSSQNLTDAIAANGRVAQGNIDQAQSASVAGQEAQAGVVGAGLDAGTSQRLAATFAQQKQDALTSQSAQKTEAEQFNAGFTGLINAAAAALPGQQALATGQALAPINKDITDTLGDLTASKAKKGNLGMKYLTQLRQSEFENEAARQTLNLKGAEAKADVDLKRGVDPVTGEPLTQPTDPTKDVITTGPLAGRTKTWVAAHPNQAAAIAAKKAKTDSDGIYTSGPFMGRTHSEVAAMSSKDRATASQAYIDKIHPGKTPKGAKGQWIPSVTAKKDLQNASGALRQVRSGKLLGKKGVGDINLKGKSRHDVANILAGHLPSALISAVLDALPQYNKGAKPHLSKETQQRLINQGYKPSQVAEALGILTAGKYKKTETPQAYDDTTRSIGNLGG